MRNFWMKNLNIVLAIFIMGVICPFVKAETMTIDDSLSGDRIFRGFPVVNPDRSITYLGVSYRGDVIEGNLLGEWAFVMQVTYPKKNSTGTALGLFAVGVREAGIYGALTGTIDSNPQGGEFSFSIAITTGTGPYEGCTGAGNFYGTLSDRHEYIEGDLKLLLFCGEPPEFRGELENKDDGNPALLLLK
mgnify:CR=1 FL=1